MALESWHGSLRREEEKAKGGPYRKSNPPPSAGRVEKGKRMPRAVATSESANGRRRLAGFSHTGAGFNQISAARLLKVEGVPLREISYAGNQDATHSIARTGGCALPVR
jgi:hypothetical protein